MRLLELLLVHVKSVGVGGGEDQGDGGRRLAEKTGRWLKHFVDQSLYDAWLAAGLGQDERTSACVSDDAWAVDRAVVACWAGWMTYDDAVRYPPPFAGICKAN